MGIVDGTSSATRQRVHYLSTLSIEEMGQLYRFVEKLPEYRGRVASMTQVTNGAGYHGVLLLVDYPNDVAEEDLPQFGPWPFRFGTSRHAPSTRHPSRR